MVHVKMLQAFNNNKFNNMTQLNPFSHLKNPKNPFNQAPYSNLTENAINNAPTPAPTGSALSPTQIDQYYASQNTAANPISPMDWLANQSATSPTTEKDKYIADTASPTTNYSQPSTPSYANAPATPDTPTTPSAPTGPSAGDLAMEKYYQSLMPSAEQTAATEYYNDLFLKSQLANEKALGSGDTLGFAAGEAQRVGRNFDIKLGGAARNVEAQASLAANRSTAAKARYEYEQGKIDTKTEQSRYDTQQEQYEAQQERLSNPAFELSAGQSRYTFDPATGEYKQTASMAPKPTPIKATVTSGSLSYTPQDATQDSIELENSRGKDGFVNPQTYNQLYRSWIQEGGMLKDFLSTFPPKNYVNPADTTLPSFLKPTPLTSVIFNPYENMVDTPEKEETWWQKLNPFD